MFVATFGVEYWLSVGHVKYENLFLFSEDTAFFACETKLLTETQDELEKFLRRLRVSVVWRTSVEKDVVHETIAHFFGAYCIF